MMIKKRIVSFKRSILFISLICILFCNSAYCINNIRFNYVTDVGTTDGAFLQDRDGFFWIGTQGGLVKFDGYTKKIYSTENSEISSNLIVSIFEDRDGLIWIATLDGINKYDKKTNSFVSYTSFIDNAGISGKLLFSQLTGKQLIAEDRDGFFWFATTRGLVKYDKRSELYWLYQSKKDDMKSIRDDFVSAVHVDREGILWIGTKEGGLSKYDKASDSFVTYLYDRNDPNSLGSNFVGHIYEDDNGVLWIGTNNGLSKFDRKQQLFRNYKLEKSDPDSLPFNEIFYICEYKGILWLASLGPDGKGLILFDTKSEKSRHYSVDKTNQNSLSNKGVDCIYKDKEGVLWIVQFEGTIDKVDDKLSKFNSFVNNPEDSTGLLPGICTTVYEDVDGLIWIGLVGGLCSFDRQENKFTHFLKNVGSVGGIYSDKKNIVLFSVKDALIYYDTKRNRIIDKVDMLPGSYASSIIADINDPNILWMATAQNGLTQYNKQTKLFKYYKHNASDPTSLSHNSMWDIHQDKDGMIWCPTLGGGLDVFDPKVGKVIRRYTHDPDNLTSISSNSLNHCIQDRHGNLWIASVNGLNKYDKDKGIFTVYSVHNGFPASNIMSLLEDKEGNLWIGSKKGLIRFNPNTEKSRLYTTADGLTSDEFWEYTNLTAKDGKVWFANSKGVNSFYPDQIRDNPYAPPVHITLLRSGEDDLAVDKAPENIKNIKLNWSSNYFEFEFVALNYTNQEMNQYAYMLEGFEDDWQYVSTRRYGRYTNLPGGKYILRVKGSNNDGLWNEIGTSVFVYINLPPWKRWWAYSLYFLFLVIVIAIIIWYIHKLRFQIEVRRLAEIALRHEKEFTEAVLNAQQDTFFLFEPVTGKAIRWNKAFNEISGYTDEEVSQMVAPASYYSPDDLKRASTFIETVMKNGSGNIELELICKDGRKVPTEYQVSVIKDEEGKPKYFISIGRDISERKKSQELMIQNEKMMSVGGLAAGMAHEINNPLAAIIQGIQNTMRRFDPEITKNKQIADKYGINLVKVTSYMKAREIDAFLKGIKEAGIRAAEIVKNMLNFSRQSEAIYKKENVNDLLDESIELASHDYDLSKMYDFKKIEIVRKYQQDIPNVNCVKSEIEQVVINLLKNGAQEMTDKALAIKQGEKDQVKSNYVPTFIIRTYKKNEIIYIELEDNGSGMDKEAQKHVFEPFYTTKPVGKGTGLGLSVSFFIITQNHNGNMWVESEEGKGAKFVIELPVG